LKKSDKNIALLNNLLKNSVTNMAIKKKFTKNVTEYTSDILARDITVKTAKKEKNS